MNILTKNPQIHDIIIVSEHRFVEHLGIVFEEKER